MLAMKCINPKCNQEMRILGILPNMDFPATVDGLMMYMCVNDDCERLGLLTPMAKETQN